MLITGAIQRVKEHAKAAMAFAPRGQEGRTGLVQFPLARFSETG